MDGSNKRKRVDADFMAFLRAADELMDLENLQFVYLSRTHGTDAELSWAEHLLDGTKDN